MLQNSIKHHFGSNGPRKSAFGYRNTPVSHRLEFIRVAKFSKTLPNIISGLMEAIWCARAKTFVRTSAPETVHYGTETDQFLIVLHAFG